MKAISFSTCDREIVNKPDEFYHYKNYTVRQAERITHDVLSKYVKSKRFERFSGVTDFWYFDVEAYQKDLEFSGYDIPEESEFLK